MSRSFAIDKEYEKALKTRKRQGDMKWIVVVLKPQIILQFREPSIHGLTETQQGTDIVPQAEQSLWGLSAKKGHS